VLGPGIDDVLDELGLGEAAEDAAVEVVEVRSSVSGLMGIRRSPGRSAAA
jgi:hypothetical protein